MKQERCALVGGRGFVPKQNEVNLALAPSQTGSSIKIFILAAAIQAGAQPNDVIDGTRRVCFPTLETTLNPSSSLQMV